MSRILHVIDQPGATGQTLMLRFAIDAIKQEQQHEQAAPNDEHAWLLFGGEALLESAHAVGISDHQIKLVPMPRRLSLPGSMRATQRLIGEADRIVCWSSGAAVILEKLGYKTMTRRYQQVTLGAWSRQVIASVADEVRKAQPVNRRQTRERWGVPDEAVMIGLVADQPERLDMRRMTLPMAFSHEILHTAESPYRDVRMVCHPDMSGRMGAFELTELLKFPQMMVQDAAMLEPWKALAGCDLVLAPHPAIAGLSLAWAEVVGLPIIAPLDDGLPMMSELGGLLPAESAEPRHLAKAITDWAESLPSPAASMLT